ncbi:MAG: hypothetical protein WDN24_14400 [Sphingomonas sp.]
MLGEGSAGKVHSVTGMRGAAAKIYHGEAARKHEAKIEAMLANPPDLPPAAYQGQHLSPDILAAGQAARRDGQVRRLPDAGDRLPALDQPGQPAPEEQPPRREALRNITAIACWWRATWPRCSPSCTRPATT